MFKKPLKNMRILILVIFLALISSAFSCHSINLDWNKEAFKAFEKEGYNPKIFKQLNVYDSLKKILIENSDSIFYATTVKNTRHNQKFEREIGGKTQTLKIYCKDINGNKDSITVDELPFFVQKKTDSLFDIVESFGVNSITMLKTHHIHRPVFIVNLKETYDSQTDVKIQHILLSGSIEFPYKFKRDTALSEDWKYYILCFYQNQTNLK